MRRIRAIRPTLRAVGLGLGAVGLGTLGSSTGAHVLVWFAITIGCLLVALGAWVAWEITRDRRTLLHRTLTPPQLQVGRCSTTEVGWPDGRSPRPFTSLTDTVGPGLRRSGTAAVVPERRGVTTLGPALVHRHDPFGLLRWTVVGRPRDHLTVWPRTDAIEAGVFHRLAAMTAGSRGAGTPDLDDLSLREYTHGDPLSRVYWKRSAPDGSLLVRHDEPAHDPQIDLVLIPGAAEHTDAAVDVLASAAEALCTPERRVRLLTPTGVVSGDRADLLTGLALAGAGRAALPQELPAEVVLLAPAAVDADVAERIIAWVAAGSTDPESVFVLPAAQDRERAEELLGAFTVVAG